MPHAPFHRLQQAYKFMIAHIGIAKSRRTFVDLAKEECQVNSDFSIEPLDGYTIGIGRKGGHCSQADCLGDQVWVD